MPNKNLTMYFSTCNHWADSSLLLLAWCLGAFHSICFGQSRLDGLRSCHSFFHVQPPLQWPRPLAALFKLGNMFPQLLWQEQALAQGSKPSVLSSPSLFAALWCNVFPWLPLERLNPRPAYLRALSYYCRKTIGKPLHLSQDHSRSSRHQCVWFHGLSCQYSHSLLAGTWQNPSTRGKSFRGQSFPMGGSIVCFQNIITCIVKIASRRLASCENKFQC